MQKNLTDVKSLNFRLRWKKSTVLSGFASYQNLVNKNSMGKKVRDLIPTFQANTVQKLRRNKQSYRYSVVSGSRPRFYMAPFEKTTGYPIQKALVRKALGLLVMAELWWHVAVHHGADDLSRSSSITWDTVL